MNFHWWTSRAVKRQGDFPHLELGGESQGVVVVFCGGFETLRFWGLDKFGRIEGFLKVLTHSPYHPCMVNLVNYIYLIFYCKM